MNKCRLFVVSVIAAVFGLVSGPRPAAAQLDMGRYVALGDSLSAGFSNGGLHHEAQLGGYAAQLASRAGSGRTFEQPLMADPGIPATLHFEVASRSALVPRSGLGSPVNLTLPRPYDNLSVPGAKVGDLLRMSTDGGGLRDLVLRGLGTQLEQALLLEPTFVSLWIGNGDVLGAAVSGIVLDGVTLTPLDEFSRDFNAVVQALASGGVGAGVVGTIPRVTDLPYVNALATTAFDDDGLSFEHEGALVPLLGPEGPLERGDFVLLSASPLLARGDGISKARGGTGVPLGDDVVLSRVEARQINDRIRQYNAVIRRAAADVGFAVAEVADLFEDWHRSGVHFGREDYTADYPGGGIFSLDGIHPSLLGQALLANAFAEAINETYEATMVSLRAESLVELARNARAVGSRPGSEGPFVFSPGASKNLRFALAVPRPGRLLRLKQRALERSRERDRRRRRPAYELPAEPVLAAREMPVPGAGLGCALAELAS